MNRKIFSILFFIGLLFVGGSPSSAMAASKKSRHNVRPDSIASLPKLSKAEEQRFQYFYLEALRQHQLQHFAAAYDLLRHCLTINPNSAAANSLMVKYLVAMQQDSVALKSAERAAALNPSNSYYQEMLAQMYLQSKQVPQAIAAYERVVAMNKDRSDILSILTQLYQATKNYPNTLKTLERTEQVEGESEQLTLSKVSVYELMGDKRKALKTLQEMVDNHPNDLLYQVMLGNWFMQNKRLKDAYRIFSRAIKEEPDNAFALSSMYDYYHAMGQNDEANAMADRILTSKTAPNDTRWQFLSMALQAAKDSAAAMQLFDKVQQATPLDSAVAQMKVLYLSQSKASKADIDSAVVELLNITPDNAPARMQLIQDFWPASDWKRIGDLAEQGTLYNPKELTFYYFAALSKFYLKDDKGALNFLQHGLAQSSDRTNRDLIADCYSIMGEILHNQGKNAEAFAALDSCLSYKPDYIMVLNNYAYYLSITPGADMKKAEQMSARTIKAEPRNATYLDTYAWVLFKNERYTEARIYIDQALANDSDSTISAEVLEHAGDIYARLKLNSQAVQFYERAIKAGGDKAALEKKIILYRKER